MHVVDVVCNETPSTSERDVLVTQDISLHANDVQLTSTLLCEHFAGCAKAFLAAAADAFSMGPRD